MMTISRDLGNVSMSIANSDSRDWGKQFENFKNPKCHQFSLNVMFHFT